MIYNKKMAEPVSVSVNGYYKVAIGNVDGSDGAGEPESNRHRTNFGQDSELNIGGSTTLDNGMTAGVAINMEVISANPNAAGPGSDEAHVYFEGAFGKIQIGTIESARQQTVTFAPGGSSNFGVNSPFFNFAKNAWISTYDDNVGSEDALKLVYFTPSFNGFQLGLSYAPDDTGGGQWSDFYDGNRSDDDEYENHVGIGLSFAQDFAGGSLSMSAGYETYDAELPDGKSCTDLKDPETGLYEANEKWLAISRAAAKAHGADAYDGTDEDQLKTATELAEKAWKGMDGDNPLIQNATGNANEGNFLLTANRPAAGVSMVFNDPATVDIPYSKNCNPETLQFGATMGFGAFTVGGGWFQTDESDHNSRTVVDFGVNWSDGPMTLGATWASSETEATGMSDAEINRFALNGTYVLGPGVDIQAQLDFGESDAAGPAAPAKDNDWVQFMVGTSIGF